MMHIVAARNIFEIKTTKQILTQAHKWGCIADAQGTKQIQGTIIAA